MKALLLVDIQQDFLPGGALPVSEGDLVVPVANRLIPQFPLVVATRDWHPKDHCSFASQHAGHCVGDVVEIDGLKQTLWPDHCVGDSPGADFAAGLNTACIHRVISTGTDPNIDCYSGFFDNGHRSETGLGDFLRERDATDLYILGLATDYCVRCTVLDALQLGFHVHLVQDGCRGVELKPGDCDRAIQEMRTAGATICRGDDVPNDHDEFVSVARILP
jgi:nicotinamidase/pyrazinamidase